MHFKQRESSEASLWGIRVTQRSETLCNRKGESVFRCCVYSCVCMPGCGRVVMDFKGKLECQQFIFSGRLNHQSLPSSLDPLDRPLVRRPSDSNLQPDHFRSDALFLIRCINV